MNNCVKVSIPVNVNPNFGLIDVLPSSDIREGFFIGLKDVYNDIGKGFKITLDVSDIKYILAHDLLVEVDVLPAEAINALFEGFIFYCKQWNGWKQSYEFLFNDKMYYENFCKYLSSKCMYILSKIGYRKTTTKDAATQTISPDFVNPCCPYELIIGTEPLIVNNIIKSEKEWRKYPLSNFLSCPEIGIEIQLPEIRFHRATTLKTQRCLTSNNMKGPLLANNFIKYITATSDSDSAVSYTHTFFAFYLRQLLNLIQKIRLIEKQRIRELTFIFNTFLNDVNEMDIALGSMRTLTSVGFHIGKQVYYRRKSLSQFGYPINIVDYVVPQVDLTLDYMIAEQDLNDCETTSFKSINALSKKLLAPHDRELLDFIYIINNKCITYTCLYCNMKFSQKQAFSDIQTHLIETHKMGDSVSCLTCKKKFEINQLACKRWKHVCK